METLSLIIIASSVVGGISFTITMSSVFLGFREWISPKSKFIEKLIHCPWCLAHWICGVMLLGSTDLVVEVSTLQGLFGTGFNFIYTLFAIIGFSGIFHYVLLRAFDPAKKAEKLREIEKKKAKKKEEKREQEKSE